MRLSTLSLLAVSIMAGRAGSARAQLDVNDTLSADGLTFTVAACSYEANGVQSSCAALDDSLSLVRSNRGAPTIEVIGHNGSNALSALPNSGLTQLTFTLDVIKTGPGSSAAVNVFSNAITGGSPAQSPNVSSNMSYLTYTANTTLAAPDAGSAMFASPALTAVNPMAVSLTLGLSAGSATTLTLAADALHFSPAPEPASIALLATGVAGLASVRRRFKKRGLAD
jgi:hypothetical protein